MKLNEKQVVKNMREFEIGFINDSKFDSARPMGNVARSFVGFIVSAAFVGLFSEVESSLAKCQEWLGGAIDSREKFGSAPEFHLIDSMRRLELRTGSQGILTTLPGRRR